MPTSGQGGGSGPRAGGSPPGGAWRRPALLAFTHRDQSQRASVPVGSQARAEALVTSLRMGTAAPRAAADRPTKRHWPAGRAELLARDRELSDADYAVGLDGLDGLGQPQLAELTWLVGYCSVRALALAVFRPALPTFAAGCLRLNTAPDQPSFRLGSMTFSG